MAAGAPNAIPLFATRPALEPLLSEVAERQRAVLESGRYVLGPELEAFEAEFASYVGSRHCVGVANGTDALTIALRALGVGPGDEVVVPSFTFYASAEAIPHAGARPVFCDVDPETFCVTADTVRAALTPRTKAVIVVHLFGNGGAITTDDASLAERVRVLRFHGSRDKVTYEEVGYNSRLDDLQAAVLRVLLPELDGWADGRRAAGRHYLDAGLGELVKPPAP